MRRFTGFLSFLFISLSFCAISLTHPMLALGDPGPMPEASRLLHLYIPAKIEFCGETVPLNKEDVLERLDTELVIILG